MKKAIIIGAGPAGLTAAHELLKRTGYKPVVLEMSGYMGGIARTINYKGNRIDIGGHRFFTKSDRVMNWWLDKLPVEKGGTGAEIMYQGKSRRIEASPTGPDPAKEDKVMLVRQRKSRIYFMRQFFDYPLSVTPETLRKLGLLKSVKIGVTYIYRTLFPVKPEKNLEQFFMNRFGDELYRTFFKAYTEKLWGVKCSEISAEWGAQRVKGLNIKKAIQHFLGKRFNSEKTGGIEQKETETSLIERFLYPKFGPGQMWEVVADEIKAGGGEIITHQRVVKIFREDNKITAIEAENIKTGERQVHEGEIFFSTMDIQNLVGGMVPAAPPNVQQVAQGLQYRDFITVGLMVDELEISNKNELLRDNWIYIQEPDVLVGRLQIFNNWSPWMVKQQDKVWIGLEYFCYTTDDIWNYTDERMAALAAEELEKIGIIRRDKVSDSVVIRVEKTYPAYFGAYNRFNEVRTFLDSIENLYPVGRNGMHKYNNQDHSMLTAMVSVDNISTGRKDKANIWEVNTEQEYHEEEK